MKKVLSMLLILAMMLSLVPVAYAANPDYGANLVAVSGKIGTGNVEGLTVTLQLKGTKLGTAGTNIMLRIDTTKLFPVRVSNGAELNAPTHKGSVETAGLSPSSIQGAISAYYDGIQYDEEEGTGYLTGKNIFYLYDEDANAFYLSLQPEANVVITDWTDYTNVIKFGLKFVGSTTVGDLDKNSIRLVTAEEAGKLGQNAVAAIQTDTDPIQYGLSSIGTGDSSLGEPPITVDGKKLPAATVTLQSIDVTLGNSTLAVPTKGKTATTTATAAPNPADATLGTVAWSIEPAYTGVSINASTGAITVSPNAAAGTVTVKATSNGKEGTTTLTLTKAAAELTTFSASLGTPTSVQLPQAGATANLGTVSFTLEDQFGAPVSGTPTAGTLPTGVTYSGGRLVVADTASVANNQSAQFTVTVNGTTKNATVNFSVTKGAAPVAPTGIRGEDAATKGGKGKLIGTTADMEYSSNGTSWTTCSAGQTEVPAGTYTVRYKETTKYAASAATAPITINQPGTSATPSVTISGGGQIDEGVNATLTATLTNAAACTGTLAYKWTKEGGDGTVLGTAATLTVTEAGTYKCEVTHTLGVNDPATGTATATVTVKQKTVVTVTKKATASQLAGALNKANLVTVEGTAFANVEDVITATVYKFNEETNKYDVVTGSLEEGTYYVDIAVATKNGDDFKIDTAVPGAGEPTDPITEGNYVKLTVSKASSGLTVTYDAGENGTVNGSNAERVVRGGKPSNVPTVTANPGFTFVGWSLDGKEVIDPTTVTINENTTFKAVYKTGINSYIKGYDNGKFGPDDKIERAQAAAMLARLSKGFDENGKYTGTASDIKDGDWYNASVSFGLQTGLLKGYENGKFGPKDSMTRAQFASLLARYLGVKSENKPSFKDIENTNSVWALYDIAALEELGIVKGYEDGGFHPEDYVTRAQAVKMINVALKLQSADGEEYPVKAPTDVSTGHWAYAYIMKALSTDIETLKR